MIKKIAALVLVAGASVGLHHGEVLALDTATAPAELAGSQPWLYARDVASTVTLDGPATVTLTTDAYRRPVTVQASLVVTTGGTYVISDVCKPSRLPMTWRVNVNGVTKASAVLNCA